MKVDTEDLVATVDIAAMLNVRGSAVTNWQTRGLGFPEPVAIVANGNSKLWLREDVLRWYASRFGGDIKEQLERHRAIVAALEEAVTHA